jgi:hypothetical protein
MKYPKLNDDAPLAMISFSKPEAQQISRAVKTLGAETIVLQVNREGTVKLECSDTANDRFSIELQAPAEFDTDHESAVQTYLADLFISLLDANAQQGFGALGQIDATFVLGQEGSITSIARNHTLLLFPQITGDD